MKINTALILCAGFGRRLNPITLETPKPLLKIYNLTLLEHCINLIKLIGIKKILINSYYLKEQINEFIKKHKFEIEIEIVEDGKEILDTGGGILNLISKSDEEDFLIFNPDTIWNKNYVIEIDNMINFYSKSKFKNLLLVVNTGCQILNKSIFKNEKISNFSISKIWFGLIKDSLLGGYESKLNFYHTTNLEIFNKLKDL